MRSFLRAFSAGTRQSGFRALPRERRHALVCAFALLLVMSYAIAMVLSSGEVAASIGEAFGLRAH